MARPKKRNGLKIVFKKNNSPSGAIPSVGNAEPYANAIATGHFVRAQVTTPSDLPSQEGWKAQLGPPNHT